MTLAFSIGQTVMMSLGNFQFGIATAAYQELTRCTEYKWVTQDRFQSEPALQFIGWGGETMSLPGVIYPEYRGGLGQIDAMRALADLADPLLMIDGTGKVIGDWVIERIEEKQQTFAAFGVPRKIEFTISLRKFGDIEPDSIDIASMAGAAASAGSVSGIAAMVNSASANAAKMAAGLTASMNQVTSVAHLIGSTAGTIIASISRCVEAANGLKNTANDVKRSLASSKTAMSQANGLRQLLGAASSAALNVGQSSTSMNRSLAGIVGLGAPQPAIQAVQGAVISANKLIVMSTATRSATMDELSRIETT